MSLCIMPSLLQVQPYLPSPGLSTSHMSSSVYEDAGSGGGGGVTYLPSVEMFIHLLQ